jgi:uncharacterized FAD-dependent dehydrogenase
MGSKNELLRIEEVGLGVNENESLLKAKIAAILNLPEEEILNFKVIKKAIDSRKKSAIIFVYSLDVEVKDSSKIKEFSTRYRVRFQKPYNYELKKIDAALLKSKYFKELKRPIIIGSGPSGLFAALILVNAGLKPIIFERGEDVDSRIKSVSNFFNFGKLNLESNVQFGEGGAGTFSDGKLYTLINDPRSSFIFSELIEAGAPAEIAYSATPHIGTDKLREVVKNIRAKIIANGGEFRFNTCLTNIEIEDNKIVAAIFNKEKILVDNLILAIGHSARDTYQMLYDNKLEINSKAFAIGLRIEHKAKAINKAQYGNFFNNKRLGTARYKLVEHPAGERSVYTFCMCPGGYVMGAASEEGGVVTNGMSEYFQDGKNSNSALLVPVLPSDFNSDHPLAGVEFQRLWEKKAYEEGGSNYNAPVQLVGDFLAGRPSFLKLDEVNPTYKPGVKLTSLENCLPPYVISSIKKAIPLMARKINGFDNPEAVLTGVETRTSSPLRFFRDEFCQSNIKGLFPAGEGAGYAGGIVSSAIDGLVVAEAIIDKINLKK